MQIYEVWAKGKDADHPGRLEVWNLGYFDNYADAQDFKAKQEKLIITEVSIHISTIEVV